MTNKITRKAEWAGPDTTAGQRAVVKRQEGPRAPWPITEGGSGQSRSAPAPCISAQRFTVIHGTQPALGTIGRQCLGVYSHGQSRTLEHLYEIRSRSAPAVIVRQLGWCNCFEWVNKPRVSRFFLSPTSGRSLRGHSESMDPTSARPNWLQLVRPTYNASMQAPVSPAVAAGSSLILARLAKRKISDVKLAGRPP